MVTPAKKTSKCAERGASILFGLREQSRQRRKYDHGSGNDDYRNSSEERREREEGGRRKPMLSSFVVRKV